MISASSKYAIKAVMYLTRHRDDGFMKVGDLSKKTRVPGPYLSKIVKKLQRAKIVETRLGLAGGVRISAHGRTLSLYDICSALGEPIVEHTCILSKKECGVTPCALHERWKKLKEEIHLFLKDSPIGKTSL